MAHSTIFITRYIYAKRRGSSTTSRLHVRLICGEAENAPVRRLFGVSVASCMHCTGTGDMNKGRLVISDLYCTVLCRAPMLAAGFCQRESYAISRLCLPWSRRYTFPVSASPFKLLSKTYKSIIQMGDLSPANTSIMKCPSNKPQGGSHPPAFTRRPGALHPATYTVAMHY